MHRLERLLRPRSIAVFGGSFAANVVTQCRNMGFAGAVWPVHPSKAEVAGVKAYRSTAELPGAPDAAFVGVNRKLTIDIIHQLRERRSGGAICFAAGFLEAEADDVDGARLQQELLRAAGDMPLIGPNCYGLINYADGALLWPDQQGGVRLTSSRGVAIVTQSSNIAINMTMQKRALPIAYVLTAGNQAQTGLSEMGLGLIEDDRVSALGLHIEGFDSVAGFARLAARARELMKPIVAMKVGRSEQARAATLSHTASLAGTDAASEAFLKRLGIARVNSIPAFLEALKLLHVCGPLPGNRLSSMSCSGGEASVVADAATRRGVCFPALDTAHRERVRETLGPLVNVANPLDYNTYIWNDDAALKKTFTAMCSGEFDLNLLVLDFPRSDRCSDADWEPTLQAFDHALSMNGARGAVVASMPENLSEARAESLIKRGIVPLLGIEEALEAAEAAVFVGEAWKAGVGEAFRALTPSVEEGLAPPAAEIAGRGVRQPEVVDEATAKTLLQEAGLFVPAGIRAATVEEAVIAARQIGFPVAVKALGVAHKSELGAVRLNLDDDNCVKQAADCVLRLGHSLYVEKMVQGGIAELIVGVTRDALFGPVMTLGMGGVLVELLQDSATVLLPATDRDIEQALRSLKMFPLLEGYRGRPPADLDSMLRAIRNIASFVQANADRIAELDINPLIVCPAGQGAWVADALLVWRDRCPTS